MRIALVTEVPGPFRTAPDDAYPAGPAARTGALVTALAGLGTEVTVHSPGPAARGPAAAQPPDLRAFAGQLARGWQRQPPDVVHAQSWPAGLAALAAGRGLDLPAVQTFHSVPAGQPGRRRGSGPGPARARLAIARAVRAVIVGTSDAGSALGRLGVPRGAIRIVPCGVDTARFTPSGPAAPRGSRPRLLMVAGLADEPGPGTALRVLADVPGAEIVIAGGPARGELAGDPAHRALLRLAGELGITDRVSFTGRVRQASMPALMRSADLLLNLSADDRQDLVTVEAMACGVPVIATEAGLHADAVINGTTGLLVPAGQPALLARRVRQLLASPLREGMAIAAASRAANRYSWARIGQETLAVYEGAARAGAVRAAEGQPAPAPTLA